jgi:hypothetical protein
MTYRLTAVKATIHERCIGGGHAELECDYWKKSTAVQYSIM